MAIRSRCLNFKQFNRVTKQEIVPIPDVEGHVIGVSVREGVQISEDGELAWIKASLILDFIKGAGTLDAYTTHTFLGGSTFTTHTKGTVKATPAGVPSAAKWTGDIIRGTGLFQGIKGTITTSMKLLTPENGEMAGKALSEGILVYTLPSK